MKRISTEDVPARTTDGTAAADDDCAPVHGRTSARRTGLVDIAEERSALRQRKTDLDAQEARIADEWRAIQTEWDIIGAEWTAIVAARRELDGVAGEDD